MTAAPAALVIARAPDDRAALSGLLPALGPARAAALQALLIARAAAWAAAAAPGAASLAVLPRAEGRDAGGVVARQATVGGDTTASAVTGGADCARDVADGGDATASVVTGGADCARAVAALVAPGVNVFASRDLDEAITRVGRGPLLVAGTGCPRLGPEHAAAALADLAAGCDVVFGATLDGGWYLAGLRAPRPELLSLAALREGGIGAVLARARELDAEVGMLRHERVLTTPDDAAALVADPLVDDALRAALSA